MSKRSHENTETYHPWSTYVVARAEASRLGDRSVGTQHLLLALLGEPALAHALGFDAGAVSSTLERMDQDALAAVGIDAWVDPLPPGDLPDRAPQRPSLRTVLRRGFRLTPVAKAVLRDSSKAMRKRRRHPGPEHVLLALLNREPPDPAAELLIALGVDRARARDRVARAIPANVATR
jgi:hypothetical protein